MPIEIATYPKWQEIDFNMRKILYPLFYNLIEGVSELTFSGIYLFRKKHQYKITKIKEDFYIIAGIDTKQSFFLTPFGIPDRKLLKELFSRFDYLKLATESQALFFSREGFCVKEDRANFDYLYRREDLANLNGRKYHKKRNLVKAFTKNYQYSGQSLIEANKKDAYEILESWHKTQLTEKDYFSAREALEKSESLALCGSIIYADDKPAAYTMGAELMQGRCFAIHFEKALGEYKGIYQFINKSFAGLLPVKYDFINREQDLGDPGLRQAKKSYNPCGFIKKYIISPK